MDEFRSQILERMAEVLSRSGSNPRRALDELTTIFLTYHLALLTPYVGRATGMTVQRGPFAGMRFVERAAEGVFMPKLLGCYEEELHPVIEEIAGRGYERIINIGCAEGYYAVGLARRLPGARVYAFDTDPLAQDICRQMAGLNGVAGRLTVSGACAPEELQALAGPGALVVCDCEGCEEELLDPKRVPALEACDLLVELHDVFSPGLSARLLPRFEPTHRITRVRPGGRNPNVYPFLREMHQFQQMMAVFENRPGVMTWAWMRPAGVGNRQSASPLPGSRLPVTAPARGE